MKYRKMHKVKKFAEWLVTVDYEFGDYERGDIISQHHTYEASGKACKRHPYNNFLRIVAADGYREMGL